MSNIDRPDCSSLTRPDLECSTKNALITRLQAFLPQMEAANQALPTENPQQIDLQLESDDDDDDDDDESDDDNDDSENDNNRRNQDDDDSANIDAPLSAGGANPTSAQRIQIKFAMGSMKDNPIIQLLADNESDDNSSKDGDESLDGGETDTRKRAAMARLLTEDDDDNDEPPSKKKPLITEL